MSTPHLIVVDVETSGLNPDTHDVLEVAAIDLTTSEELHFVPTPTRPDWQTVASPEAMQVNRYYERGVFKDQVDDDTTRKRWIALAGMLDGNIIAGANPQFDAAFVDAALRHWKIKPTRRHQLRDLATYASGILRIDPAEPTSSATVLDELGIINRSPHSALGDATAAAAAFSALRQQAS